MKLLSGIFFSIVLFTSVAFGKTFHVSLKGDDSNPGTQAMPLRTIQHAADLARPGDTIIVHEGIYREYINPPRGGTSDTKRIVYEAAPGEKVVIKGSEIIKHWIKIQQDVWQVQIPNSFFGSFNPYSDTIHGDWFNPRGRKHHTGAVYLNGNWLTEAAHLEDVWKPVKSDALWFGKVDEDSTTIWAQFKGVNPNEQLVEINVRQSVFYPKDTGINYITVRGFTMEQAATPWAPPTAQQIGLIGPNWSKGWIIENNVIKYSMCSGISLGKYGDQYDNTAANTAEGYVKTIERALKDGWTKQNIGHHIVKNNTISHCEQTGIVGSLGAIFSTITGNTIHDICSKGWLAGAELAGIKVHAAVDVSIAKNHIYDNNCLGIWLDWMAQGTRVLQNLLNNNNSGDIFVEVDHGPFMIDNNISLSFVSILINSQGGAYCHNLFAGRINIISYDGRQTPFLKAHSTGIAGFHDNPSGDSRFFNNIFSKESELRKYDSAQLSSRMDGNVFLNGVKPLMIENEPIAEPGFDPEIKLIKKPDGFYLQAKFNKTWIKERKRQLVTTALLGKTAISHLPYEQSDGKPIRIYTDYFGKQRNKNNPAPGPFENFKTGLNSFKVF
jgi:alpha-N-arabinofuranosidase